MLVLQNVGKIYQRQKFKSVALKNIHLNIAPKEIFGILGRKDAGKTTLLRCAHCLEYPNEGSIALDNSPLHLLNPQGLRLSRRFTSFIFAKPMLLNHLSVYENVALPLKIAGVYPSNAEKNIQLLLQRCGIHDKAESYPSELNLFQQYRVSIARALVNQPKIILCDDITLECDPKSAHLLIKLLKDLHERFRFTLIKATQNMEVIKTLCQRACVLHEGEIVEEGTVHHLFMNPQSEITKEFVKSSTRFELPLALRKRLKPTWQENTHPVLRLSWPNQKKQETLLADILHKFDVSINIVQAHLERVQDTEMAIMIAECLGKPEVIQDTLNYLIQHDTGIEVLGYVS